MDFFQHQDAARRNTTRLVFFFVLAVLGLIVITNLLVMVLFGFLETSEQGLTLAAIAAQFDWQVFFVISVVVLLVILGGSTFKMMALSGGGTVVAESLGGRLISQNTTDLHERKVLNVVEEMAIASGTPVPPVYLLEHEEGINAFAAGYTPSDAVIGVTRGTIAYLSRDELQGVIAHEFSHILHGDMRLNIRLIGILHGILLIGLIGYFILRSVRGSSKNAGPIIGLGLGLLIIGYTGTFFGNLIKASVSRQREFLADASAVQFTRSKQGIAGALKKIGGYAHGSELEVARAAEMSHAFFSKGISSFFMSVFATHPPLDVRITRIEPQWDGEFPVVTHEVEETDQEAVKPEAKKEAMKGAVTSVIVGSQILDSVGQTGPEQLAYATTLLKGIPENVRAAVHEPYGARAVIYSLVIGQQADIREKQLQQLRTFGDTGIYELTSKLVKAVAELDISYRLPLIDMALPALRQLSAAQYDLFKNNLRFIVRIDNRIEIFEWVLQKILFHHLDKEFGRPGKKNAKYGALNPLKQDINVLLSMLVYACVTEDNQVKAVFNAAEKELGLNNLVLVSRQQITIDKLDASVEKLALLKPLLKPRLLKACLALITYDQEYSASEMELMRAIADTLDCPLPPSPLASDL
ncbi:MAG: M48 family metallopeptidase [Thioalkalispiraceae bacterium]|jgi:Zn-dependent protease with chaperone function